MKKYFGIFDSRDAILGELSGHSHVLEENLGSK